MKLKVLYSIILVLLLFYVMGILPVRGSASLNLPVQNLDTGFRYSTIQEAIDASATLDRQTILVNNGTYNENIVVRKSLTIIGAYENTTVISFTVNNVNNCRISEFSIENISVSNSQGDIIDQNIFQANRSILTEDCIDIQNSSNIIVYNNTLVANQNYGVFLNQTSSIIISGNTFTNSFGIDDVKLQFSSRCIIDGNLMSGVFGNAIELDNSDENLIENNWMHDMTWDGIDFVTSYNNTVLGNTIESNWRGILIDDAYSNGFYENSLINNGNKYEQIPRQVVIFGNDTSNYWNGDQGKGNYWSNYNGQDLNNDGIGDTPYTIDSQNQDNYPSMRPCAVSQQELQVLYASLQNDYANSQTQQNHINNELLNTRTQMYLFIITTAIFGLASILLITYIIQRKHSTQRPES